MRGKRRILLSALSAAVVVTAMLVGVAGPAGAVEMAQQYSHSQLEQAATWAEVSRSADSGQDYPVELPHA